MIEIIKTLVFASALLIIMVYPAMLIADWLSSKIKITPIIDDKLTVILTILLSIIIGALLNYA